MTEADMRERLETLAETRSTREWDVMPDTSMVQPGPPLDGIGLVIVLVAMAAWQRLRGARNNG